LTRKGSIVPTHSHVNEQGAMIFVTPMEKIGAGRRVAGYPTECSA
jgi:hypothetical protein